MKWSVTPEENGLKLVAYLKGKLGDRFSSSKIKTGIEGNLCILNGAVERFASKTVKQGDRVEFKSIEPEDFTPQKFEFEDTRVLYEDDDFFIYNKPAGITSDGKGLAELFSHFYLIHRLDRDTSGVLMFAKNPKTRTAMIDLFRKYMVKKTYLALVHGKVEKQQGKIKNYLGKIGWFEGQTIWGPVTKELGREAITEWACEKSNEKASLLRCYPKTGRTHQLRVHLSGLNHPVIGDYQYGRHKKGGIHAKRCLLHALEVSFKHPTTGESVRVNSPPPVDFQQVADEIEIPA